MDSGNHGGYWWNSRSGMGVIPDFPATDYITAVAVGMFNGLSATGVNQVIKQTTQKE